MNLNVCGTDTAPCNDRHQHRLQDGRKLRRSHSPSRVYSSVGMLYSGGLLRSHSDIPSPRVCARGEPTPVSDRHALRRWYSMPPAHRSVRKRQGDFAPEVSGINSISLRYILDWFRNGDPTVTARNRCSAWNLNARSLRGYGKLHENASGAGAPLWWLGTRKRQARCGARQGGPCSRTRAMGPVSAKLSLGD